MAVEGRTVMEWLQHVEGVAFFICGHSDPSEDVRVHLRKKIPLLRLPVRNMGGHYQTETVAYETRIKDFASYFAATRVIYAGENHYLGPDVHACFLPGALEHREIQEFWCSWQTRRGSVYIIKEWRAHNPIGYESWL